jgi:ribokinase
MTPHRQGAPAPAQAAGAGAAATAEAAIVVLGSVNLDTVLRCPRLPAPGETVQGHGLDRHPGGKGANQAVAASRLGAPVRFIGCVGEDDAGRSALASLTAENIDTSGVRRVAEPTGTALVLVEDSGQNCIALHPGANEALDRAQVDAQAASIRAAQALVCQLETPQHATWHAIGIARAAGVRVLLNPAPAQAVNVARLAEVDVLVPNESEAMSLALLIGAAGQVSANAREAALQLRAAGVGTVVVTLGGEGVLVADAAGMRHFAAPPVDARDTSGAGDTFVGALAVALGRGATLDDAIGWAQAAAAISVTRRGTMDAMPHAAEMPRLAAVPAAADADAAADAVMQAEPGAQPAAPRPDAVPQRT